MATKHGIKTVLLLLAIAMLSAGAGYSQTEKMQKTPGERAAMLTEKMRTELDLTESEYPLVQSINLKYAEKNEKIIEGSSSRLSKFKSLKRNNEDKNDEMKSILSKAQFARYREMQRELKEDAKNVYKDRKDF